jgi:pimeloyl-ACP methyl ester carboxylesterase
MPILKISEQISLAYNKLPGKSPGVIFCCGFMSDMTSTKALALEEFCRAHGQAYVRFDYQGCGASSGQFSDGTISLWRDNALAILDKLTAGPQILVGSSMGGWIALLTALAQPERVAAVVGIAAAPDFSEELIWDKLTPEDKIKLLKDGIIYGPSAYSDEPYAITKQFIEDGRKNLLLQTDILLDKPVRLLQGMQDPDVPWQYSLRIAEKLTSQNVRVHLIKDGDHRLVREQDLALLKQVLGELL